MAYDPQNPTPERPDVAHEYASRVIPPLRDQRELLANDARNRSVRTFLQGVGIDIAVAVAALVLASVDSITDKAGLIVFFTALGKTIITTIASFVMRQYLDRSSIPTPLPPADPGEPDAPIAA